MFYPDQGIIEMPAEDMPEDVRKEYSEASMVLKYSTRASAALFRLAIQKLVIYLGQDGKDLNTNIRSLANEGKLKLEVITALDTVRITGNESVHPGSMSAQDIDEIAKDLAYLINYIVEQAITEPKKRQELYNKTPISKRKAAENDDEKSKGNNA